MKINQLDYRNIVKSTSIFGGTQLYQIIINIVKVKVIAVLIGTFGMGLSNIFVSTLSVVVSIAGLSFNYTATREIAQAVSEKDYKKVNKIYSIQSKLLHFTSTASLIIVIFFSSYFSILVFGNKEYKWAFVWLSITVLFNIITIKNNTLLQGTRRLKDLAKNTIIGASVGLFISLPIYYVWGIKGIVPALIITAFSSFLVSQFFVNKIGLIKIDLTIKETLSGASDMLKFGVYMMLASFMGNGVIFVVNAFISNIGSIEDVGLYGAGIRITSQFAGLVFTAMSLDYFPRLSAISSNNLKLKEVVNQQSEIIILIVQPLLMLMILFSPSLIKILLTNEFIEITNFVRVVSFGTIFQAAQFIISFIPIAKGDKKNYFIWNACFNNLTGLIVLILGYKLLALNGLAIALLFHNLLSFLVFLVVTNKNYKYKMSKRFFLFLIIATLLLGIALIISLKFNSLFSHIINYTLFIASILFSIYYINKLISIKNSFNILINTIKKVGI